MVSRETTELMSAQPGNGHYRTGTVAILIPCYNEEQTVAEVVSAFREQLPYASIYVFDNNSTDRTAETAREAGARAVGTVYEFDTE